MISNHETLANKFNKNRNEVLVKLDSLEKRVTRKPSVKNQDIKVVAPTNDHRLAELRHKLEVSSSELSTKIYNIECTQDEIFGNNGEL